MGTAEREKETKGKTGQNKKQKKLQAVIVPWVPVSTRNPDGSLAKPFAVSFLLHYVAVARVSTAGVVNSGGTCQYCRCRAALH